MTLNTHFTLLCAAALALTSCKGPASRAPGFEEVPTPVPSPTKGEDNATSGNTDSGDTRARNDGTDTSTAVTTDPGATPPTAEPTAEPTSTPEPWAGSPFQGTWRSMGAMKTTLRITGDGKFEWFETGVGILRSHFIADATYEPSSKELVLKVSKVFLAKADKDNRVYGHGAEYKCRADFEQSNILVVQCAASPGIPSPASFNSFARKFNLVGRDPTLELHESVAVHYDETRYECVGPERTELYRNALGDCGHGYTLDGKGQNFDGIEVTHFKYFEVDFSNASFKKARFNALLGPYLGSKWNGVSSSFEHATFTKGKLVGDFTGSNFNGVTFSGTEVSGKFWQVDFRNGKFGDSKLTYADFYLSDFRGSDLSQAQIGDKVNLQNAMFDAATKLPFSKQEALRLGMRFVE